MTTMKIVSNKGRTIYSNKQLKVFQGTEGSESAKSA